jgi:glyoxylase-like metal-dependent hydrolase (beta-lactamase superfamily II)
VSTEPILETLPVGPLQCNCSILGDPVSGEAVVIDPGDEPQRIVEALTRLRLKPVALLHTHAHFDHIGGTRGVRDATGALIRLHADDLPLYDALPAQAEVFGLHADAPLPADSPVADGERIAFGPYAVTAIHTPGHTPGSTCYRLQGNPGVLFSGDTLFRRSIGRTDLWGGDSATILASIRDRLYALPDDLPVICGHGPGTTIAEEKRANPFVNARTRSL